ncbi:MAG: hypothetical protein E7265_02670 [Lachnospiraceae bacterium]|nr:hypothetical protein [Lachnospiraceae bacterium]
MPAIWGFCTKSTTLEPHNNNNNNNTELNLSHINSLNAVFSTVKNNYNNYKIESFHDKASSCCHFGYGHQQFTPEAANEHLPMLSQDNSVLFTSDCVIDNRQDLLSQMSWLDKNCSDGRLLYEAWLKWGEKLTDYVIGAYAFAVYITSDNTLHIFTDHMANRSIFYYETDDSLMFSTAIVPLANAVKAVPSEKWIGGCLSTVSADMMLYEHLTPYEGILQMPSATHLIYGKKGISLKKYWSAKSVRGHYPHKDTMEYREQFVDTFNKCVSSVLRSDTMTGCTLSSGLDSSCIASLAAKELAKRGQSLHSYTSVPLKEYIHTNNRTEIADESKGVYEVCKMYPNIIPQFLECPDKDAFSELKRLIPLIGYPMKSGYNLAWLDAIYSKAASDGCKLMLKGQYGNSTISWGKALSVFYQLICHCHPIIALKMMRGFGRQYNVPRKTILKFILKEYKNNFAGYTPCEDDMLCSNRLNKKNKYTSFLKKTERTSGGGEMDSAAKRKRFIFNETGLMQLGMFDTIMSLIHGVLIRDPAKDMRIVTLCCQLPVECGIAGYVERGMVRTYMKGIVPDLILNDLYHRGIQSADYAFRCKKMWSAKRQNIINQLNNSELNRYANNAILENLINTLRSCDEEKLTFDDLRKANVFYACSVFLSANENRYN